MGTGSFLHGMEAIAQVTFDSPIHVFCLLLTNGRVGTSGNSSKAAADSQKGTYDGVRAGERPCQLERRYFHIEWRYLIFQVQKIRGVPEGTQQAG